MVGSLGGLYESIEKLSDVYMQPCQDKDTLLKPKVLTSAATNLPQLLPNIESSEASEAEGGLVKGMVQYQRCCSSKITIKIGMHEAVRILKASLQSKTVLTGIFFGKKANF
ncbi:hypothetical protein DITRI_Ditri09bG0121600 [Diplodiscus trichospermus]